MGGKKFEGGGGADRYRESYLYSETDGVCYRENQNNPVGRSADTGDELLLFLTQELLHISPESSGRIFILRDIKEYLLKIHNVGNRCGVITDEVHKISDDVLECIRLLNNLARAR